MEKNYGGTCGVALNKRHHFRNIARRLLDKKYGLSDSQKLLSIYAAREALTVALQASPEGRQLLKDGAPAEIESLVVPENSVQTNVSAIWNTIVAPKPQASSDRRAQLEAMLIQEVKDLAKEYAIPHRSTMNKAELIDSVLLHEADLVTA